MSTQEKAWIETRALALAKVPGKHKHPTVAGLYLDVSPKLKAVWRYRFTDSKGEEISGTLGKVGTGIVADTVSLKDALKRYANIREYHKSRPESGALTLESAFNSWLPKHKKKGGGQLSPRTVNYYQENYNRYLRGYGNLVIDKITPTQWDAILSAAKARSISAARGTYWMLHALFEYYVELEVFDRNPLAKRVLRDDFAPSEDVPKPRTGYLRAINIALFIKNLQKVKGHHSKDAVMMLLYTGWRLAAVLQMKWEDIDFEKQLYKVGKHYEGWKGWTGKIPLSDYVIALLKERQKIPTANGVYVFPGRHGNVEHMRDIQGALDRACEGLGYRLTAHDLRRTFATIGDVIFDGNKRIYGPLMGHKYSDDKTLQEESVTDDYVQREWGQWLAHVHNMNTVLLELADMLPLDEDTIKLFAKKGITLNKGAELQLAEDVID